MARTKVVPPEGLLSDLEYTSVIVSRSIAAWKDREHRRKGEFKGFGKGKEYITVAVAGIITAAAKRGKE